MSAEAYTLMPGGHTVAATAADMAGNAVHASAAYEIRPTIEGVAALLRRFAGENGLDGGIIESLAVKLLHAAEAERNGDDKAKAQRLKAFLQELSAQTGKAFTAEQAAALSSWAERL